MSSRTAGFGTLRIQHPLVIGSNRASSPLQIQVRLPVSTRLARDCGSARSPWARLKPPPSARPFFYRFLGIRYETFERCMSPAFALGSGRSRSRAALGTPSGFAQSRSDRAVTRRGTRTRRGTAVFARPTPDLAERAAWIPWAPSWQTRACASIAALAGSRSSRRASTARGRPSSTYRCLSGRGSHGSRTMTWQGLGSPSPSDRTLNHG